MLTSTETNVVLTRSGICYDLENTPYKAIIEYEDERIIYNFSASYNAEKFLERLENNRNTIKESLKRRFGFIIENEKLSDIKLYQKIENRGFLIESNKEGKIKCLNNIKLNGQNKILQN